MLRINLGTHTTARTEPDQLGRTGSRNYRPGMTPAEVFDLARGCWKVNPDRVARETHAIVVVKSTVVGAFTIDAVYPVRRWPTEDFDRYALTGAPLQPGDPFYDRWIGQSVNWQRAPISYPQIENPPATCACGCGVSVLSRSAFIAGHDQRAIHERIARIGSVKQFLDWFDQVQPATGTR